MGNAGKICILYEHVNYTDRKHEIWEKDTFLLNRKNGMLYIPKHLKTIVLNSIYFERQSY